MLFNRFKQISPGCVTETAAAVSLTKQKHANKVTLLDKVNGQAFTLPKATGSGDKYTLFVKSTITSVGTTIKVPDSSHVMQGNAITLQDGGDTMVGFEAGATADTVTLNGTTTGGLRGHIVTFTDVDTNLFMVESVGAATGTEATPFSATV